MEKNNEGKINILVLLVFVLLVIIIVMGAFIYKLSIEKKDESGKVSELKSEVETLNNTISGLQGKIDTISETINSKATDADNNMEAAELSEEAIKNEFETAWKIYKKSIDIFKYDANTSIDLPVEGQNYTWKYYKITNYNEIVDKYISSKVNNLVDNIDTVISRNGNYYLMDSTDGTSLNQIDEIKNLEKASDKVSCVVRVHSGNTIEAGDKGTEENYEFELVKENNTLKVSKFSKIS